MLAAFQVFTVGFMLLLGVGALLTEHAWAVAMLAPIPIALWNGIRVSVTLTPDGGVVVRNQLRTHRIPRVAFAVLLPTGSYGALCINFIDVQGRVVSSFAMTLWSRADRNGRPSPAAERLAECLAQWTAAVRRQSGFSISLNADELHRAEFKRRRFNRAKHEMSLADPVESLSSVRRALVNGALVSIRPSGAGFRVHVDVEGGVCQSQSEDYPTLEEALDEAIAEVRRRSSQSE